MKLMARYINFINRKKVPTNGMDAHKDGYRLKDNPFPKHTPEHSIWRDDWLFSAGMTK